MFVCFTVGSFPFSFNTGAQTRGVQEQTCTPQGFRHPPQGYMSTGLGLGKIVCPLEGGGGGGGTGPVSWTWILTGSS